MNEKDLQEKVSKYLKSIGFWVYRPNERMRKGIPDILAVRDGAAYAYELKYTNLRKDGVLYLSHHVSAIQVATLFEIADKGGKVGIIIGFEKDVYVFFPEKVGTIKEVRMEELLPLEEYFDS